MSLLGYAKALTQNASAINVHSPTFTAVGLQGFNQRPKRILSPSPLPISFPFAFQRLRHGLSPP